MRETQGEPVLVPAAVRKRVMDRWKKAPNEEIVARRLLAALGEIADYHWMKVYVTR